MATSRLLRERRRSMVAGMFVLVAFLAMAGFAVTATNGLPGQKHRSLKVSFTDVGALRNGDDVRIAGIRVGRVEKIALEDGHAVVTLSLDGKRKIYRDATVVNIAQRSALGQAYVNVSPGDPKTGELPAGSVISENAANSAQDLTNVLNVLDAKTRASLQSMVREVGNGSVNHGADLNAALATLPRALPDLGKVSSTLTKDNGANLTGMLTDAESLARSFSGQQQELTDLARQLDVTLTAVAADGGEPLAQTLKQAPATLTSVRDGLSALKQPLLNTAKAVSALRAGADSLGAATPALRSFLRDGVAPLNKVPSVANQAVGPVGELTPVMSDLRPLAPRVAKAINQASTPLAVVAPYHFEIEQLFYYLAQVLKDGDSAGHWLRFYIPLNTESVDGIVPIPDPITKRDAYPAPGTSLNQRSTTILGSRK